MNKKWLFIISLIGVSVTKADAGLGELFLLREDVTGEITGVTVLYEIIANPSYPLFILDNTANKPLRISFWNAPTIPIMDKPGSFYLKDPIYNVNHGLSIPSHLQLKSASDSGFIWNDAFEELREDISGSLDQKYGLKAVPEFVHENITWQWVGGDFNPSSTTDILLLSDATKSANYKCPLVTTEPSIITQAKDVGDLRLVVYKSIGEVCDFKCPSRYYFYYNKNHSM